MSRGGNDSIKNAMQSLDVKFHVFSPTGGIVRSAPPASEKFDAGVFTVGVDLLLEPGECLMWEVRPPADALL